MQESKFKKPTNEEQASSEAAVMLEPKGVTLQIKEYMALKHKIDYIGYVQEIFWQKTYQEDVIENFQPKSVHAKQMYQYKMEAFTPELRTKYSKDTKSYAGIVDIRPKFNRQKNSLSRTEKYSNISVGIQGRSSRRLHSDGRRKWRTEHRNVNNVYKESHS